MANISQGLDIGKLAVGLVSQGQLGRLAHDQMGFHRQGVQRFEQADAIDHTAGAADAHHNTPVRTLTVVPRGV